MVFRKQEPTSFLSMLRGYQTMYELRKTAGGHGHDDGENYAKSRRSHETYNKMDYITKSEPASIYPKTPQYGNQHGIKQELTMIELTRPPTMHRSRDKGHHSSKREHKRDYKRDYTSMKDTNVNVSVLDLSVKRPKLSETYRDINGHSSQNEADFRRDTNTESCFSVCADNSTCNTADDNQNESLSRMRTYSVEEVVEFVRSIDDCKEYAEVCGLFQSYILKWWKK